jgi:hypothetical protein
MIGRKFIGLILLLALALGGAEASADDQKFYKWVDDEGVVHYSASPPSGVEYEEVGVDLREPENRGTQGAPPRPTEDDPAGEDQAADMLTTEVGEPDPEEVAERCEQYRTNLENLQREVNVFVRGDDGERTRVTEEERQRLIDQAQQFIEENC